MIIGVGLDLVELERIKKSWQRFGESFAKRILRPEELEILPKQPAAFLGSRFAAKEAAVKALGTGFNQGLTWQDLQVYSLPSGQPRLAFHNQALSLAQDLQVQAVHLSLTHERGMAAAMVVLEKY